MITMSGWTNGEVVAGSRLIAAGINEDAKPEELFRVEIEIVHAPRQGGRHTVNCHCGDSKCTGKRISGSIFFVPTKNI